MNADKFITARLAAFSILEAGPGASVNAMNAIAFVMRNRVQKGWQGGDWMKVLDAAGESRGTEPARMTINLRDAAVKTFLPVVDDIYDGTAEDDLTDGALFYAELHRGVSPDFIRNIVRRPDDHPRMATVDLMAFFG